MKPRPCRECGLPSATPDDDLCLDCERPPKRQHPSIGGTLVVGPGRHNRIDYEWEPDDDF